MGGSPFLEVLQNRGDVTLRDVGMGMVGWAGTGWLGLGDFELFSDLNEAEAGRDGASPLLPQHPKLLLCPSASCRTSGSEQCHLQRGVVPSSHPRAAERVVLW